VRVVVYQKVPRHKSVFRFVNSYSTIGGETISSLITALFHNAARPGVSYFFGQTRQANALR
jgi:hypothetical protein